MRGGKYTKLNICDGQASSAAAKLTQGYVLSPFYPDYYGNSLDCVMSLPLRKDRVLFVYLLRLSVEPKSSITNQEKDFLQINNAVKYTGLSWYPILVYNGTADADSGKCDIRFESDWLTLASLASPKGFMIYFECVKKKFVFLSLKKDKNLKSI